MNDPILWATEPQARSSRFEEHVLASTDAVSELRIRANALDKSLGAVRAVKGFFEKLGEQHREHARMLGRMAAADRAQQVELGNTALQSAWAALNHGVARTSTHHAELARKLDAIARSLGDFSSRALRGVREAVREADACELRLMNSAANATRAADAIVRSWEEMAAIGEALARVADAEDERDDARGDAHDGRAEQARRLRVLAEDKRDANVVLASNAHTALSAANAQHDELHGAVLPAATRALHALRAERQSLLDAALRQAAAALAELPTACAVDVDELADRLTAVSTAVAPPLRPSSPPASAPFALPQRPPRARTGAAEALLQKVEAAVSRQNSGAGSGAAEGAGRLLRAVAHVVSSAVSAVTGPSAGASTAGAASGAAEVRQLEIGPPSDVRHVGHVELAGDGALSAWGAMPADLDGALVTAEGAPAPPAHAAPAPPRAEPARATPGTEPAPTAHDTRASMAHAASLLVASASSSDELLGEADESAAGWLSASDELTAAVDESSRAEGEGGAAAEAAAARRRSRGSRTRAVALAAELSRAHTEDAREAVHGMVEGANDAAAEETTIPAVERAGSLLSERGAEGAEDGASDEPIWSYLGADVSVQGPVTLGQLLLILTVGAINADSYVWREGMADWAVASSVDELRPALGGQPIGAPMPTPHARGVRAHDVGAAATDARGGDADRPAARRRHTDVVEPVGMGRLGVSAGGSARRAARRASASARALVERAQAGAEGCEGAEEAAACAAAVTSMQKAKMRHVARKSLLPQASARRHAARRVFPSPSVRTALF